MSLLIICYLLYYCSSLVSYGLATSLLMGNETDQFALLQFKAEITDDPFQVLSSWNTSNHFCHWQGVKCSRGRHPRVTALNLTSLRLQGSLSPYIGNLSFLTELNLQYNGFRNQIPREIGSLFRLRFLGLTNNSFAGEVPANISRCINLEYLGLGNNELIGKVPSDLSFLSKLRLFFMYGNNLSGEIPYSFGNLSSIEVLSGGGNQFVGRIPETLSLLRNMYEISFHSNKLSGEIPLSIYNITSLVHISFSKNQLRGSLPSELGFTLPNLKRIDLSCNHFTGLIPSSLSISSNLIEFLIAYNGFSGKVPSLENLHNLREITIHYNRLGNGGEDDVKFLSSLVNATSLEVLEIHNNKFRGLLPHAIANFSTLLNHIDISNNEFVGSIPIGIGSLVSLEKLHLENNRFTGRIPSSIGELQKLKDLLFGGNMFSGEIPSSFGNLSLLTRLDLMGNVLQGSIPSSLGRCQNLQLLNLSNNNLNGTIPREVIGLSSLSYLDLSRNQLTGSLPSSVGIMVNLVGLNISHNNLSGEIPSSLGSCVMLRELDMKGNFFQGTIPSSLSSLSGLSNLDLSCNNLSGYIPKFLENFPFLKNINLSYNDFESEVPIEGVFKNLSVISLVGNNQLCGGIAELHLPSCSTKLSKQTWSLKLIIPIVVGILVLIVMVCLMIIYKTKEDIATALPLIVSVSHKKLLKATDGLSLDNLIGVGRFGSMYKGVLDRNGTVVAVKVFNLETRGASKSFTAECEVLRSIRHRNLVKIITVCACVVQGSEFKAIIYEFMLNGRLEDWLHPNPATNKVPSRRLNFLDRLNIVIDVACALDYLHNDCETPVVHCDLKPSNVFLDYDMVGRVGDFGLARFLPNTTNNFSSNQTSSIGVRGTIGYAAPEYTARGEVATDSDVYSFGILLLEMFTEKRPTDRMFNGDLNLHTFVKAALPEQVTEIVGPQLLEEKVRLNSLTFAYNRSQRSSRRRYSVKECLILILGIGVSCSSKLPRERMNMDDVAAQLISIRNKLLNSPQT